MATGAEEPAEIDVDTQIEILTETPVDTEIAILILNKQPIRFAYTSTKMKKLGVKFI